jgi:hypothetical protein
MKKTAAALVFTTLALACAPSMSASPLGFYFLNRALDALGGKIFGALGSPSGPAAPPGMEATAGVAELLNESLPLATEDNFTILAARAPAPGALEVIVTAPSQSAPSAEQLDASWGPGLATMFCAESNSIWRRWIVIGGSVGVSIKTSDGELIRQYGVAQSDCKALASR